ncbi:hypothetical protein Q664_30800 [Archangium violaceum Cb vi76]|uniref:Uncharacterized protein n=1 Tax=Archangium violaceum Cb vi76 TaxID=1406225 RepID=A0A084SNM9_9BACT|nr:hypothetical protein Q664_30800 [Archangium violaceum Cb vi76]
MTAVSNAIHLAFIQVFLSVDMVVPHERMPVRVRLALSRLSLSEAGVHGREQLACQCSMWRKPLESPVA